MKKRIIAGLVIVLFLLANAGCSPEVIGRKFVRKKKPEGPPKIYYIEQFQKPPNVDIYTNAYVFWKTWESELLYHISQKGHTQMRNMLKVRECAEQSLINLKQMQKLLQESRSKEMAEYVEQLQTINATLQTDEISDSRAVRLQNEIEKHKRFVERNFCLTSAKNDILPDPPETERMDITEESPVFKKGAQKKERKAKFKKSLLRP